MKKVLLVDRDTNLKEAFKFVFPEKDWTVIQALNSDEALREISLRKPDLAFVSSDLGDMKGSELIKILQDLGYLEGVKVYLLQEEGSSPSLSGIKVSGVIKKPINYLNLYEVILEEKDEEEILRRKREEESEVLLRELSLKDMDVELNRVKTQISEVVESILNSVKEEIFSRIEPVIRSYLDSYVQKNLPQVLEKLLREKIDELVGILRK